MDGNGRDVSGRFAAGHRGGPGRPPGRTLSAELRRQGDSQSIAERLLAMITDPKTSNRDRLAAIQLYGDRTEGKPEQSSTLRLAAPVDQDEDDALADQLSDAELDALDRLDDERDRVLAAARQRALPAPTDDDSED
jgi:hypothetical protein